MLAMAMLLLATASATPASKHATRPVRYRIAHVMVRKTRRQVRRSNLFDVSRLHVTGCAIGASCGEAPSRYRLPLAGEAAPTVKELAVAEDGRQCAIIGQTICPSRTRKILKSGETPRETIAASFGPK